MNKYIVLSVFSLVALVQSSYVAARPGGGTPFTGFTAICVSEDAAIADVREMCHDLGGDGSFSKVTPCPPQPVAVGSGAFPVDVYCNIDDCEEGFYEFLCKVGIVPNN